MTIKLFYLNDPLDTFLIHNHKFGYCNERYAYDLYSLSTGSSASTPAPTVELVQRDVDIADWHCSPTGSQAYKEEALGDIHDASSVEAGRKLVVRSSGALYVMNNGEYRKVVNEGMVYADGLFAVSDQGYVYKYEGDFEYGDLTRISGISGALKVAAHKVNQDEFIIYDGTNTVLYSGSTVIDTLQAPGTVVDILGISSTTVTSSYLYMCMLNDGTAWLLEDIRKTWLSMNLRSTTQSLSQSQVIPVFHTKIETPTGAYRRPHYFFLVLHKDGALDIRHTPLNTTSGSNLFTVPSTFQIELNVKDIDKWARIFYDPTETNKYYLIGQRKI